MGGGLGLRAWVSWGIPVLDVGCWRFGLGSWRMLTAEDQEGRKRPASGSHDGRRERLRMGGRGRRRGGRVKMGRRGERGK